VWVESVGRLGVILFFLHTSLVLMMSLERAHTDGEGHVALRFYLRRCFRVYPLAIFAVLLSYVLRLPANAWSRQEYTYVSAWQLLSNVLLIQNVTGEPPILSPLWSLPLEVEMHVLLPWLFLLLTRHQRTWRMIIAWMVAGGAAAVVWIFTRKLNLFAFIPCFLSGIVAYNCRNCVRRFSSWLWPTLVSGLCILVVALPYYRRFFLRPQSIALEWIIVLMLGLTWSKFDEQRARWLVSGSAHVAKYSYGIYLGHTYALWFSFRFLKVRGVTALGTAVIGTAVLAVVGFHLIEQPMIKAGKQLVARIVPREVEQP